MISFNNDYSEGAHPDILDIMLKTNMEQTSPYGLDYHCAAATEYIKELCNRDDADVHFMVGGTQVNLTVAAAVLRPHQGVIAASSGHISIHETGAIEAQGHKVLICPGENTDGKITTGQIKGMYEAHYKDETCQHMVQPGMVYISHPSECGTTYSKKELTEIYDYCKSVGIPLYIDGARLGYAIAREDNDLSLSDIASLCDVFYIGGTKVGALFGEAVVILNPQVKMDFRYIMKQKGGLLAKGRLLGIQFEALFKDGLYFTVAGEAVKKAIKIRNAFEKKGFKMLYDSDTNQQFPILTNKAIHELSLKYTFSVWEKIDSEHTAVRFCTSWATTEENVNQLISDINNQLSVK